MDKGYMQFYVGDGKGKTTAMVGQIVRAHGAGLKCAFYQFLKARPSGESEGLLELGITVERAEAEGSRMIYEMDEKQRGEYLLHQRALYTRAVRAIHSGEYDVVALDELLDLIDVGGIDLDALRMALAGRPAGVEVLLSGRRMPRKLTDLADYITEMRAVKHPYNEGVEARRGIEY